MAGRLGRRAPVYSRRSVTTAALLSSHLARLGTAPSCSVDRLGLIKDWGVLGNDLYGCCVEADTGHDLLFRTTIAGAPIIPTTQQILALYSALTGFDPTKPDTDQGTDEQSMCDYLVSTGFLGHRADATVCIAPTDLDHIRWAIELFGSCRFGINFPASAAAQFASGQPWDVVPDDGGIQGRHDIRAFNYRDGIFDVITWGKAVPMTAAFAARYLEEAHAELFYDWIEANGRSPGGFDLGVLASDLNSLAA